MLRDLFSLFPAYAGVIHVSAKAFHRGPSFPRIRGGDPIAVVVDGGHAVLFPAYAGVIPDCRALCLCQSPFPRIRGGDPSAPGTFFTVKVFSPHTRG